MSLYEMLANCSKTVASKYRAAATARITTAPVALASNPLSANTSPARIKAKPPIPCIILTNPMFAIISTAPAIVRKAIATKNKLMPTFSASLAGRPLNARTNKPRPPATPNKPLEISSHPISDMVLIANASMSSDPERTPIAKAALRTPSLSIRLSILVRP